MSSGGYDEIVAATYAGWVVGLNSEPQQKEAGPSVGAQEPISEEVQAKMENLRCDIHWFEDIYYILIYFLCRVWIWDAFDNIHSAGDGKQALYR